jgi:hypothetical protein
MLEKFDRENIDLLFTDTDNLCYHIKNQDPNQIINENRDLFDLANLPKDHFMYDKSNNKVIGKMKIESENAQITEFIGLRSKLYSFTTDIPITEEQKTLHKKCKGCKTSVVNKVLSFDNYKNTLLNRTPGTIKQNGFRSYKHKVYTEEVSKVALSCYDDKCYIHDDNINTYTFGHYKIGK